MAFPSSRTLPGHALPSNWSATILIMKDRLYHFD